MRLQIFAAIQGFDAAPPPVIRTVEPPEREPVILDDETLRIAKPMLAFQDSEVKRLKPIIKLIRQLQRELEAAYSEPEPMEAVSEAFRRWANEYQQYLEGQIKDAAQAGVDDTKKALSNHYVLEATEVQQTVDALPAVQTNLHHIPDAVYNYATQRGRGETGFSLSQRIWSMSTVHVEIIGALMQGSLQAGRSPQQFAQSMRPYLLPGAELPTAVPSDRVSNKPRNLPYNAFRLARTEIMQAYNHSRISADRELAQSGVVVGTRWVLSRTHAVRVGYDICDYYATRMGADMAWLAEYGVDTKGIWAPGTAPTDHPNGLCTTVPVPTPRALFEKTVLSPPPEKVAELPKGDKFDLTPPQEYIDAAKKWFESNPVNRLDRSSWRQYLQQHFDVKYGAGDVAQLKWGEFVEGWTFGATTMMAAPMQVALLGEDAYRRSMDLRGQEGQKMLEQAKLDIERERNVPPMGKANQYENNLAFFREVGQVMQGYHHAWYQHAYASFDPLDKIVLWRGVRSPKLSDVIQGQRLKDNPATYTIEEIGANSWTTSFQKAKVFDGGQNGLIFRWETTVGHVLSKLIGNGRVSGFGWHEEYEWVVAAPGQVTYRTEDIKTFLDDYQKSGFSQGSQVKEGAV